MNYKIYRESDLILKGVFPLKVVNIWILKPKYEYVAVEKSGCDTRSFFLVEFSRFEFSFPSPKLVVIPRSISLTILPIDGGRIAGYIPLARVLALYEMQRASSSIWTQVTMSISYNGNRDTTDACRHLLSLA